MKSVYCAVRTGSLNKAVCASYLNIKFRYLLNQNFLSANSQNFFKILLLITVWRVKGQSPGGVLSAWRKLQLRQTTDSWKRFVATIPLFRQYRIVPTDTVPASDVRRVKLVPCTPKRRMGNCGYRSTLSEPRSP